VAKINYDIFLQIYNFYILFLLCSFWESVLFSYSALMYVISGDTAGYCPHLPRAWVLQGNQTKPNQNNWKMYKTRKHFTMFINNSNSQRRYERFRAPIRILPLVKMHCGVLVSLMIRITVAQLSRKNTRFSGSLNIGSLMIRIMVAQLFRKNTRFSGSLNFGSLMIRITVAQLSRKKTNVFGFSKLLLEYWFWECSIGQRKVISYFWRTL
jgi:hypothetical protein